MCFFKEVLVQQRAKRGTLDAVGSKFVCEGTTTTDVYFGSICLVLETSAYMWPSL